MRRARPEETLRELRDLIALIRSEISADDYRWAQHLIEHNEPGIALLGLADTLVERGKRQSPEVVTAVTRLGEAMEITDQLPRLDSIR